VQRQIGHAAFHPEILVDLRVARQGGTARVEITEKKISLLTAQCKSGFGENYECHWLCQCPEIMVFSALAEPLAHFSKVC
jgi:hypothetical protein